MAWKAHILRSMSEEAKQDALKNAVPESAILIMDWALKFIQMKYREKQADWFGKRGLSWHITTLITNDVGSGNVELKSYAHIFDSCQQDWYAIYSIIENTLQAVKKEHPQINRVSLRSDEAGCYHNNFLMAAVSDAGKHVGITVTQYDFSEPQMTVANSAVYFHALNLGVTWFSRNSVNLRITLMLAGTDGCTKVQKRCMTKSGKIGQRNFSQLTRTRKPAAHL